MIIDDKDDIVEAMFWLKEQHVEMRGLNLSRSIGKIINVMETFITLKDGFTEVPGFRFVFEDGKNITVLFPLEVDETSDGFVLNYDVKNIMNAEQKKQSNKEEDDMFFDQLRQTGNQPQASRYEDDEIKNKVFIRVK